MRAIDFGDAAPVTCAGAGPELHVQTAPGLVGLLGPYASCHAQQAASAPSRLQLGLWANGTDGTVADASGVQHNFPTAPGI